MAGDWIKMRADLQTHPKVVRILSAIGRDKFAVIGGLHAVWSLFDAHSEDGLLSGYNLQTLDLMIGFPGFANAMVAVGWLEETPQGLVTPRFDEHNGASAKRRVAERERKRAERSPPKSPKPVREMSAKSPDKSVTREEKRRDIEIPPNPPPGGDPAFDEFVAEFPVARQAKFEKAWGCWREVIDGGQATAAELVQAIRRQAETQGALWAADGGRSCPLPDRWLRDGRWRDQVKVSKVPARDWRESRSGVEAMGESLGLGRWDQARFDVGQGETFEAYERRVAAAIEAAGRAVEVA